MKGWPINCMPIGNPLDEKPHGTLMPGKPARFTPIVYTSHRYIANGSALAPRLNAGVGAVGVMIASTSL